MLDRHIHSRRIIEDVIFTLLLKPRLAKMGGHSDPHPTLVLYENSCEVCLWTGAGCMKSTGFKISKFVVGFLK